MTEPSCRLLFLDFFGVRWLATALDGGGAAFFLIRIIGDPIRIKAASPQIQSGGKPPHSKMMERIAHCEGGRDKRPSPPAPLPLRGRGETYF